MIISCIVQISHVVILYFPELELLENEYVQRIWFRLRLKRYSHRKWRIFRKKLFRIIELFDTLRAAD